MTTQPAPQDRYSGDKVLQPALPQDEPKRSQPNQRHPNLNVVAHLHDATDRSPVSNLEA